jgi:molybdenum cofactor guanylyltransferase
VPSGSKKLSFEVCILAGGLSTRMGRDKTRLRIGGRTMLTRVRQCARTALNLPSRIIRKDAVARCGPLGGVVTALRTSRAEAVLFLACDMPLVTPLLLRRLVRASRAGRSAAFTTHRGRAGFPFIVGAKSLPIVEQQIAAGEFSLQSLARKLRARRMPVSAASNELLNVNTPAEAKRLRALTPA